MANQIKSSESRFGVVAVSVHWISALLILVLLGSGFSAGYASDAETKAAILRVHLPVAVAVLLLTIARLIWWWRFDRKPSSVGGVAPWQDRIARWTHRALYVALLLLLASGIAVSILSGLPDALYGEAGFPELAELPPRVGHGIAARLLVGLVLLHAGAALYHHWVLKDGTLKRIWFQKA
ncbi:cytochrome b [Rhodophyticola sp.]|jgi:cytochrome b561|uniref:cytochrome b n=1 Tax=Rhodophyticola sp. TaxID=2680032 RepID=UPI003D29482F